MEHLNHNKPASITGAKTAGFTLIEVLLSLAIFMIGAMAIVRLQGTVAQGNADSRRLAEATKIAREVLEQMQLVRSFYAPDGKVCAGDELIIGNNHVVNAFMDPGSSFNGQTDVLCPTTAMEDDLDRTEADIMNENLTDVQVALVPAKVDRCIESGGACVPVDANLNSGTSQAMYWVVWNLRAGFPPNGDPSGGTPERQRMTTIRLYVFWRGFDGRRHMVSTKAVMTAKDAKFYY